MKHSAQTHSWIFLMVLAVTTACAVYQSPDRKKLENDGQSAIASLGGPVVVTCTAIDQAPVAPSDHSFVTTAPWIALCQPLSDLKGMWPQVRAYVVPRVQSLIGDHAPMDQTTVEFVVD